MNSQQARILQLIANRIGSHPSLDTNIDELGLDSLAMAELMYDIESTFQIHTDDGILELDTVQDLCDYLEARISGPKVQPEHQSNRPSITGRDYSD